MKRRLLIALSVALLVAAGLAIWLPTTDLFVREVWRRDRPLVNPLAAAGVQAGAVTLADGRTFRPAGVRRREAVSAADYDAALRAIVAQGVVPVREVAGGRHMALVEPKFYNWCGTHTFWEHPAGVYAQCGLSEALVFTGYAEFDPDAGGLTPRERWRLEGAGRLAGQLYGQPDPQSFRVGTRGNSLRDGGGSMLEDLDGYITASWKEPPG